MTKLYKGVPFEFDVSKKHSPIYLKTIQQLTLAIPGGGCKRWLDTKGRCCPFCAFPGLIRSLLQEADNKEDFQGWLLESSFFEGMYNKALDNTPTFDKLAVFNGGSFIIDSEIPADFRHMLYKDFANHPTAKQLMVETIPEGVTEKVLAEAKERLGSKDFMIGIGLESSDNRIRNKLLKKATSLKSFEKAVRLMQSFDVQVFVYVFLKAPGLSEKEAFEDVIKTMNYLSDLGVDEIGLSTAFVQTGTPLETLYNKGEFRPPWLWTIMEIMDIADQKGWPLSIGGFEDHPQPIAIAHNCTSCDDDVLAIIDKHRSSGLLPHKEIYCDCKQSWRDATRPEHY